MSSSQPTSVSIQSLRGAFDGRVVAPGDAGYEQARRVFYRSIDRRPAVIIRPADAAEVARVVALAADTGLELAVRSGGHSLAGYGTCEGGIVLDLSAMKALEIDAEQRTAWAQTGLTAGEYTVAAGRHGLATGFGDTGAVGIGGLALGGGLGFLVRKYGLTVDHLLAAEVVTADGRLLHVDDENHPDLFWAIRGGGGNFGVATRFRFRLHPVDTIVGGMLLLPATAEVIRSFVAEAAAAPDELLAIANIMLPPPDMPMIPSDVHGQPVLMAYCGDPDAGNRVIAPFRALATPIADQIRPMRYPEIYQFTEGGEEGPAQEAAHSMFLDAVDGDVAEAAFEQLRAATAPLAVLQLRALGGAMARVPAESTAFPHRHRPVMAAMGAVWEDPEESAEHQAWVAGMADALRPRAGEPGVYVGFLGDEGEARVHEAYPVSTWARLAEIKARYDPDNLFRLNQNVPPTP